MFIVIIFLVLINFYIQQSPVFRVLSSKKFMPSNSEISLHDIKFEEKDDYTYQTTLNSSEQGVNSMKKCETIHIGIVCTGHKPILYLMTMLKSIYFYRNNPLHFHIMVNKLSDKALRVLFESWAVPQVNVSFYDISNTILDVRWVPNSHYSGVYGLLKLTFPKIIKLSVTNKIIILDTDLILAADIVELWKLFKNFDYNQAIGLVENQSDYYLGKKHTSWPAIARGFNTGVMLYDLERLKHIVWDKLWNRVAKKTASIYGSTKLADQDIINAVIKQHPEIVYNVPCYWNTQLSDHTLSYKCYKNYQVKIVHWNSPKKINVKNKDSDYFKSLYVSFLEFNGNLFRRRLHNCFTFTNEGDVQENPNICSDFDKAQTHKWRTLLFFRKYDYVPQGNDVTFAVQLSYDRLQMIEELCLHWNGPISIVLYVSDPELQSCIHFIENSEILQDRYNVAFHAVFKDGDYYPINILRNIGLRNVNTPYVFLADIDFLPMYGLYQSLHNYINNFKSLEKKALIVPAFETQKYRSKFPKNKRELIFMLDNKSIFTFRFDVWASGHAPTNYVKWRTAKEPYKVKWEPDFEPYIIVKKEVTEYDNRFLGFGWNKVSHIMELEAQGYEFYVLPNAFIIHKPHAPSYDIMKFRKSPEYRMCLQNLKEDFVDTLRKKYGRIFDNKNNTYLP